MRPSSGRSNQAIDGCASAGSIASPTAPRRGSISAAPTARACRGASSAGERLSAARDGKRIKEALERALALDPTLEDARFGIGLYKYYADIAPTAAKILRFLLLLPGGDKVAGLRDMQATEARGQLVAGEALYQLHWIYFWYEQQPDRGLEALERLRRATRPTRTSSSASARCRSSTSTTPARSLAAWQRLDRRRRRQRRAAAGRSARAARRRRAARRAVRDRSRRARGAPGGGAGAGAAGGRPGARAAAARPACSIGWDSATRPWRRTARRIGAGAGRRSRSRRRAGTRRPRRASRPREPARPTG